LLKYVALRIGAMIPLMFLVLFIVFSLGKAAPGDPIRMMYMQASLEQADLTEAQIQEQRERYGLNDPFFVQFYDYAKNVVRGDLGVSITENRDVLPMIVNRFAVSAQLGLLAVIALIGLGIPLGIVAARKHNTPTDYLIVGGSLFIRTVPVYVLAPLILWLFVLKFPIMDVPRGWRGMFSTNVILPVFLLMLFPLAVVIRQMRASMLEVLGNEYVRTARAKGLSEYRVTVGHVLRNALTPVTTELGLVVTGLITGSIFVESIFGIPGYGRLAVDALLKRDYPLMLGCTLFGAFLVMMSNLIVDLVYPLLDPRVKL
jgi:ABC-type dipeptide/oligopeptide/nickel transport system permease component